MKQFLLAAASAGLMLGTCCNAQASTHGILFAGAIVGETITGSAVDPEPQDPDLLGRAFKAKFLLDETMGSLTAETFLTVDISGHPGYLTGPEDPGGPEPKTYTANDLPTLVFGPGNDITGSAAAVGGYSISFDYVSGAPTASLTADFALNSISRADDPGGLTLDLRATTISNVPLPAAAPLFGAALLALGAVGRGMMRRTVPTRSAGPDQRGKRKTRTLSGVEREALPSSQTAVAVSQPLGKQCVRPNLCGLAQSAEGRRRMVNSMRPSSRTRHDSISVM